MIDCPPVALLVGSYSRLVVSSIGMNHGNASLSPREPTGADGTPTPVEPTSVPWSSRDAWWGLALGVAVYVFIPLILGVALSAFSVDLETSMSVLVPLGSLLWILPVWWFASRKHRAGLPQLGFRAFSRGTLGVGCGLMIAVYFASAIYSAIVVGIFGSEPQPDLEPLAEELSVPWLLPLTAITIAPVVEEAFFRGFFFAGLSPRYGWQKAAVISSFFFAIMHLQPLAIPVLFLLGYLFAYLYHRSHSLWLPILMHFIVNTLAVSAEFLVEVD